MEPGALDSVKREKEKAMARFNRFRRIVNLWQFFEVLFVLGLFSWSSSRVPAVVRATGGYIAEFSNYLLNHHVVFLIGNAIIVLLVTIYRKSGMSGGDDIYGDYVKYSEAASAAQVNSRDPAPPLPQTTESGGGGDGEKQLAEILPCDDVAAAIENAARQIEKFQRTQSEKLRREISVRPRRELRRSETDNHKKADGSRKYLVRRSAETPEIERMSNEEFQRIVDAFIDKHWSGKKSEGLSFQEHENCPLLKIA